jgi:hypothetical protein
MMNQDRCNKALQSILDFEKAQLELGEYVLYKYYSDIEGAQDLYNALWLNCLVNQDKEDFSIYVGNDVVVNVKRLYTEPLIFYIYEFDFYLTYIKDKVILLEVKDVVKYVKQYAKNRTL